MRSSYFALLLIAGGLQAAPQLKFAAVVIRHGVRSPTWEPARLNQYSAQPWPDFGVPPGNLTPRGAQLIKLMGGYYHDWFVREKLISPQGCADAERVRIWADTDQRTVETGRALSVSLLPGCKIAVGSLGADESDPLFAGSAEPDAARAREAIQARLKPHLFEDHKAAFDTLQDILGDAPKKLFQPLVPVSVSINGAAAQLNGPFNTGSTLSENLLLEYANGFAGKELGWGRLNEAKLQQVLEIHTVYADLMRRTPYLAATRGANLIARILGALRDAAAGKSKDAMLVLAGHDTNLSNLSGMLGLTWRLPGYQPDDTPPGGALVFSLWRDGDGPYTVRVRYVAQSMMQMHEAAQGPPEFADVLECSLADFQKLVEKAAGHA